MAGFPVKDAVRGPWYKSLKQPPFNPPKWVFPVVWTIMYTLMGIASTLIYRSGDHSKSVLGFNHVNRIPFALYAVQMTLNALWPTIFFYYEQSFLALVELLILDVFIVGTTISFWTVDSKPGWFMVPYVAWSLFATLLNYSVWLLNYDVPSNNATHIN